MIPTLNEKGFWAQQVEDGKKFLAGVYWKGPINGYKSARDSFSGKTMTSFAVDYLLAMSDPNGPVAGGKKMSAKYRAAIGAEINRLLTTPEGGGELVFILASSALLDRVPLGEGVAAENAAGDAASVARSALGKGQGAVPGAALSDAQRAALLQNRADTIANIERAVNNESLSPQLRERMFRLGMDRVEKINQTLESGVVPPKH